MCRKPPKTIQLAKYLEQILRLFLIGCTYVLRPYDVCIMKSLKSEIRNENIFCYSEAYEILDNNSSWSFLYGPDIVKWLSVIQLQMNV